MLSLQANHAVQVSGLLNVIRKGVHWVRGVKHKERYRSGKVKMIFK